MNGKRIQSQRDFERLVVTTGNGREAIRYGRMVHKHSLLPGAHRTPAAEEGNDILSHSKGKYGELLFLDWLKRNNFLPSHTPFRDDYSRKVDDDDFIVNGTRIEIKAKMRGESSPFPPPLRYNVNLGKKEIEKAIHVFIEISPRKPLSADPPALILGWALPQHIRQSGVKTWPGKLSDNGRFTFKRYDWDIAIGFLIRPEFLTKYLNHLGGPKAAPKTEVAE